MSSPNTAELLDHLLRDRVALSRRQAEADRVIAASGAGHLVHEMNVRPDEAGSRPWRIDPVPLIVDGPTFDRLAAAIAQRMRAFESILADLYGPRQLVRDGVVAGEALSSSRRYRMATVGAPAPPRWLTTYAADVVALADGTWRIVQDFTDAPTGVGYALLDRSAMMRVADEILGSRLGSGDVGDIASLNGFPAELRHALITTTAATNPRIVLFTGGVNHPGYVEHSSLARTLGFTLVERPDLVVRQGRLWLRTLAAGTDGEQRDGDGAPFRMRSGRRMNLDPVDVVYRRIEDDHLDPIEIGAPGGEGVPGLLGAVAERGVVLANAHGSGVIEDSELADGWAAAAEALTGESFRLPMLGGEHARSVELAQYPIFRNGDVSEASVVVRLHAVAGPDGVAVMPGGNGRVLGPGDDPRDPGARRAKDVWVIGEHAALPVIVAPQLPQVDLAASVPTRAADALFWSGRAAERAEAIARTLRVIAARRRQDPGLVTFQRGAWARRMAGALRVVRNEAVQSTDDEDQQDVRRTPYAELDAELVATTEALVSRLRSFVAEAATVGEFLASNTARILNTIVRLLDSFDEGAAPIDAIDDVLAALAAYMGMWNESTVRGPAWRFGDIGIRLERALIVLELVSAFVEPETDDAREIGVPIVDVVATNALESLLAANECLIAYRRQYRSDVEIAPTLELLLRDRDNPRAFVSCLDRVAEHVADVDWPEGSARVALLTEMVAAVPADALAGSDPVVDRVRVVHDAVGAFAGEVVDTWFATPVKPVVVRARRSDPAARR
ncbi:circularly permuted type 2 ATP-grasp protein [Desertimonas flava]|uniref:circularly permuted type 2 ATP-grasp protein n=1 Tax=Desertimonas flava TaxID=2064846 RepID=UPI000E34191A|nr:circularly permuted type 2 ATP-grasp protein [Desertimonas flava]